MRRAAAGVAAAAAALATAPAAPARLTATTGFEPGAGRIVIARDDGSHRRVLGGGDASWISPDGRRVAVMDYAHGNGGGNPRLKLFRAKGGPPLFVIREDMYPVAWSPDSAKLVAAEGARQRLVLIDAATGTVTTLAAGDFGDKSFSPDSKRLAAVRYSKTGVGSLVVIDLATRALTMLRHGAVSPVWGPRAIAFGTVSRHHGHMVQDVATIRPDGTQLRRLTHVRATEHDPGLYPLDWSADGRRLLARFFATSSASIATYGVDAVHGGARLIARHVAPDALARDGRSVIGQTGNPFCCAAGPVNVVRIPWAGGTRQILLRKAFGASSNG